MKKIFFILRCIFALALIIGGSIAIDIGQGSVGQGLEGLLVAVGTFSVLGGSCLALSIIYEYEW